MTSDQMLVGVIGGLASVLSSIAIGYARTVSKKLDDLNKERQALSDQVTTHEVTLYGAHAQNGLAGDMKQARTRVHRLKNDLWAVYLKLNMTMEKEDDGW